MTERPTDLTGGQGPIAAAPPDEGVQRDELARLLVKLSAPLPDASGGRYLRPSARQGLLSALLDEIDNTVMARCLRIEAPDGAVLLLEISNRRLLDVSAEAEVSDRAHDQALSMGELGFASLEDLTQLRALLERHCGGPDLRVESLRPSGRVGVEQTGVSVATLRQAFALEMPAPQPSASIAEFAAACVADVLCWQANTGEAGGDDSLQDAFEAVWELWPEGLLAREQAPALTILSPDDPSDPPLLLAQDGEEAVAMLLEPQSEPRIAAIWLALKERQSGP